MAQAIRRQVAWVPVIGALTIGAALTGVLAWRLNLQSIERQVTAKRGALKKLVLSGNIPPNQEVMDYLTSRQTSLDARYESWVKTVDAAPLTAAAAVADPQLYFQEQFHEVQRTLERLSAARGIAVPEQLGFPKEIPPSDTVPRLLGQLALIQQSAQLILDQGVTVLSSLKVEDPEMVSEEGGEATLLVRLPVRVRLAGSLPQLMKILGAIDRARPFIDLREIRVVNGATEESLDAELLLARYLVMAAAQDAVPADETASGSSQKSTGQSKPRSRRPKGATMSKEPQD